MKTPEPLCQFSIRGGRAPEPLCQFSIRGGRDNGKIFLIFYLKKPLCQFSIRG